MCVCIVARFVVMCLHASLTVVTLVNFGSSRRNVMAPTRLTHPHNAKRWYVLKRVPVYVRGGCIYAYILWSSDFVSFHMTPPRPRLTFPSAPDFPPPAPARPVRQGVRFPHLVHWSVLERPHTHERASPSNSSVQPLSALQPIPFSPTHPSHQPILACMKTI